MRDSRALKDLFQFFPYRKNPPLSNTIPVPYVKKEDVSDHQYALTYSLWKAILEDIILEIRDCLIDGETWNIGSHIGTIEVVRFTANNFIDYKKSKEQSKVVRRSRTEHDNIMIKGLWSRKRNPLPNKSLWRFKLCRTFKSDIYKRAETDFTLLYKFSEK